MCYLKRGFARYRDLLHREVLGITNGFPYPSDSKRYEKEPRYNETLDCGEHILSVSWPLLYRQVPLYRGSFSHILLLLGKGKSFVISRTSLCRGSLYRDSTAT